MSLVLATPKGTLLNLSAVLVLLIIAGCKTGGGGGGGITIAQSDGTAPTVNLSVGQQGGSTVTVSDMGSAQLQLTSKTGSLNVIATAKDPESGVQAVEIWMNKKTTTCDASGNCTNVGPGLLTRPAFESKSPKMNPGDKASESSILAQAVDLSKEIAQGGAPAGGSLTVELIFSAVALNHLGGRTETPTLTVTWKEP